MSGDVNTPIPDHAYDDFRYLLKLLRPLLSAENGWRDDLDTFVPAEVWGLWSCYKGSVLHYQSGEERSRGLAEAHMLPEYVVSWTTNLDEEAIEAIGRTVADEFVPSNSAPAKVGQRWVEEANRTAFRLHFLMTSDRFD